MVVATIMIATMVTTVVAVFVMPSIIAAISIAPATRKEAPGGEQQSDCT